MAQSSTSQTIDKKSNSYCRPQLKKLGSVDELTHSAVVPGFFDNAFGFNFGDISDGDLS